MPNVTFNNVTITGALNEHDAYRTLNNLLSRCGEIGHFATDTFTVQGQEREERSTGELNAL